MIGQTLAQDLQDDEVLELIGKIIEYYQENGDKKRLGRFIERIGFERFKNGVLH